MAWVTPARRPVETGAGELKVEIVTGAELCGVGLHGSGPGGENRGIRDIDQDGGCGRSGGVGGDFVEEEGVDGVRGMGFQFGDAAVSRQAGSVADHLAKFGVIGVLVGMRSGSEDDGGFVAAEDGCDFQGVGGAEFEMGIAAKIRANSREALRRWAPAAASAERSSGVPFVPDSPREQTTK